MPNSSPLRAARPDQAPVALLLPPVHLAAQGSAVLPDWHGVAPVAVAYLIRRYTRPGDTVLSPDGHPAITGAARFLDRAAAVLGHNDTTGTTSQAPHAGHVALILAAAPAGPDLAALAAELTALRTMLRPGGFLILALPVPGVSGGISHRATTIAAARTAGLYYHQHIPALLAPLPDDEPRTSTAPGGPPARLWGARHVPVHRDLLAFATTATDGEAASA